MGAVASFGQRTLIICQLLRALQRGFFSRLKPRAQPDQMLFEHGEIFDHQRARLLNFFD